MTQCAVTGCRNSFRNSRHGSRSIHYHRFPKTNSEEYPLWIRFAGNSERTFTNMRICSDHFDSNAYASGTASSKPKLLKTAVPTIHTTENSTETSTITDTSTSATTSSDSTVNESVQQKPTRKPRNSQVSTTSTRAKNKRKPKDVPSYEEKVNFFMNNHRILSGILLKDLPFKKRYLKLRKLLKKPPYSPVHEPEPMDSFVPVEIDNEDLIVDADPGCLVIDETRDDSNEVHEYLDSLFESNMAVEENSDWTEYKTFTDINDNENESNVEDVLVPNM